MGVSVRVSGGWYKSCTHQIEPDPAGMVVRHQEQMTVIDWVARLRCSRCGERAADFVVTGARR